MDNMISMNVIRMLPPGCTIIRKTETKDMDGMTRNALLVTWWNKGRTRKMFFCSETGEYLGDTF